MIEIFAFHDEGLRGVFWDVLLPQRLVWVQPVDCGEIKIIYKLYSIIHIS